MKKSFKDILDQILKDYNLNQHQLAAKIGVSQSTISRWFNGIQEPGFSVLRDICIILDISGDEILGLD